MTYGWALLVIVIILIDLSMLSAFDARAGNNEYATGFTSFSVNSWTYTQNGDAAFSLANLLENPVSIQGIKFTDGITTLEVGKDTVIGSGQQKRFVAGGLQQRAVGTQYNVRLTITFITGGLLKRDEGVFGGSVVYSNATLSVNKS